MTVRKKWTPGGERELDPEPSLWDEKTTYKLVQEEKKWRNADSSRKEEKAVKGAEPTKMRINRYKMEKRRQNYLQKEKEKTGRTSAFYEE